MAVPFAKDFYICTLCGAEGAFHDLAGAECNVPIRKDVPKPINSNEYKPQEATRTILRTKKTNEFIKKVTQNEQR